MNFNFTPDQMVIAVVSLIAAICLAAALFRRDDASEVRRKKYVNLAGKLRKKNFTFVANFLECLAVKDYDGALGVAESALSAMEDEKTAQEAVELAVGLVNRRIPDMYNSMGLIAVDVDGRVGAAHNSRNLCWTYITPEKQEPEAYLSAKIVK